MSAAGISRYGAYVPAARLPLGKPGGPERAVAGFDEDAITMAVAAAADCLEGGGSRADRSAIDALIFASASSPFREKQAAALVARALDLRPDIETTDVAATLRSGSGALMLAADKVAAGSARSVLVVISDMRTAEPRTPMEANLGDAAAAFLVSATDTVASFGPRYSLANELLDVWRAEDDRYVRQWEDRFVVAHGYLENTERTVTALLEKAGLGTADIDAAALYAPDARSHKTLVGRLGLAGLVDPMFGRLGNCGSAFAPLLLISALEGAHAGERILVAAYGDGADAFIVNVEGPGHERGGRLGLAGHLARRREIAGRAAYLAMRGLFPDKRDRQAAAPVSATQHFRERDADISFAAARCRRCHTMHFPAQRVCYKCHAKDDFERAPMAGLRGKVMAYTFDHFFPVPEPPLVAVTVEVEGGCRVYLMMTEVRPDDLAVGLPVEFCFRKIHEAGAKPNYFWKCRPRTEE